MAPPLKDQLNQQTVELLADRLARACSTFNPEAFVADVTGPLLKFELKDRVNLVADQIAAHLPGKYTEALSVVVRVADEGIDEWAAWPLCSFVERHGVDFPVASLDSMEVLTTRWSCEFALRPFLHLHLELTREHLRRWVTSADESVRRLASEGTRPLLPWAPRVACLSDDPSIGIEVLESLRHDESETVRRSVANHLNDISKAKPDLVVALLREWCGPGQPVDNRMVVHALRTLVKRGHPGALTLLGFTTNPAVEIVRFSCSPSMLVLGGQIELTAEISSTTQKSQLLVVDFVVHHVTASGATSPKVFKWKNVRLEAEATAHLFKRRRIQAASTRRYHSGRHRVDLQVAGNTLATTSFGLTAPLHAADGAEPTHAH